MLETEATRRCKGLWTGGPENSTWATDPDGGLPVSVSPRHNQPASHTGRLAECFHMAHCAQPRQRRPRPAPLPGRVRSHVTGPVTGSVTGRRHPPWGHKAAQERRPGLPPCEGAEGLEGSQGSRLPLVQLRVPILHETFGETGAGKLVGGE